MDYIEKHWNKVVPSILHYDHAVPANLLDSVSQKIRDEYMEGKTLTKETFPLFIQVRFLMGDEILFLQILEKHGLV